MATINDLVKAVCPEMPDDRRVSTTSVLDKYYHINLAEKTLFVPTLEVLRANLSEVDRFIEACHAFAKITDWESKEYRWDNLGPFKHYESVQEAKEVLDSILEGIHCGTFDSYIVVDIETRQVHWEDNRLLCIGIAYQDIDGTEYTISFEWPSKNVDYLNAFFGHVEPRFVWHNGKFDIGRLKYLKNVDARVDEDTMLMHYIGINERRGTHSLKDLGPLYLQAPKWDDQLQAYKKSWCASHKVKLSDFMYDDIPLEVLIPYLHMDCLATLRLYHKFKNIMRPGSEKIYRILIEASNIYSQVELNGVYMDTDYCEELRIKLEEEIAQAEAQINIAVEALWDPIKYARETGARAVPKAFNMKSPKQLKWLLEKILQRPVPGTGADILEELAKEVEGDDLGTQFIKGISAMRKYSKYLDTYVIGLQQTLCNDHRIRCSYNLHGTETGRLSSSDPNMQNIPRDKLIRNLFVAPEGKKLVQLDYSQAELRVLAYLSDDDWLTDVYVKGDDLHDRVALQMFGPDFDKEQRVMAKTINFGIAYGRGAQSLSDKFGLSNAEAQKLIDNWFLPMPKVKAYLSESKQKPFKNIPVTTVFGRQRSFIITSENRYRIQNEAMNMPIQSTASDCTLISLCTIHKWIQEQGLQDRVKIIITVHDSIVLEVDDDEALINKVAQSCIDIMENVPKKYLPGLRVPFVADAEVGYKWGELSKWTPVSDV